MTQSDDEQERETWIMLVSAVLAAIRSGSKHRMRNLTPFVPRGSLLAAILRGAIEEAEDAERLAAVIQPLLESEDPERIWALARDVSPGADLTASLWDAREELEGAPAVYRP